MRRYRFGVIVIFIMTLCLFLPEYVRASDTEINAEAVTEAVTEIVTEAVTETVTEAVTKTLTEAVIKTVTEAVTETVTEAITETVTEAVTETVTEAVTETATGMEPGKETAEVFLMEEYAISFEQPEGASLSADKDIALSGERVTVSLDLDRYHKVSSVKYNGREAFPNTDGTFVFLMPAEDIVITAELVECDPAETAADFGFPAKMPVPFGTASSSSAFFIYPCNERLASLPWDLLQLVPEEGYNWEYEYVADKPAWKTTLTDYANIFSFIHDHELDPEAVREILSDAGKMVHRKAFTDEEIDLLLGDDEEAVMKHFASENTIVIGNKAYSPGWMYYHTIKDYEAEGITPEMAAAVLPYYYNALFVQEAADAFSQKMFCFTSILTPVKWEQWKAGDVNLDGMVDENDISLAQSYVDGEIRLSFRQWASVEMTGDNVVNEADVNAVKNKVLSGMSDEPTVMLDVMEYCQYPDYPTGCESVSLYMLLKYYDIDVTVDDIYDLLPMGLQPYDDEEGVRHGANPEYEFVGDPRSAMSYGVFHKPIAKVAQYFKPGVKAEQNASINDIKAILDTGNPVLAWYVSQPMRDIMYRWSWIDENNTTVSWPGGEHAIVICGYDDTSLTYRDPNAGTTVVIDYDTFERNFSELGGRIVYYMEDATDAPSETITDEMGAGTAATITTTTKTVTDPVTGEITTTTVTVVKPGPGNRGE